MELKREYAPTEVSWPVLMDWVESFRKSIPKDCLTNGSSVLTAEPEFSIRTFSQEVEGGEGGAFLEFIRKTKEPPTHVSVRLACFKDYGSAGMGRITPEYLVIHWSETDVRVTVSRVPIERALGSLASLEERLRLTPASPALAVESKAARLRRTVFIAHAFDDSGRSHAFLLTKFLSLLGFEVATGEGFSPESVASKVKRRLAAQEIAIAVISAQDDMTWLTQESTRADFENKPLFILVEEGATFKPGMLGDREYVRFPKGRLTEAFTPVLEGLREIGFAFK